MKQKIGVLCAVRDDAVASALMRELDDGESCMFQIVRSGTDALRAAQRFAPDIMVVDAVLSGLDGPALIDRLRAEMGERLPRMIGGVMLPFAADAFVHRGVKRLVHVPWDYDELREAILSVIDEIESVVDWNRLGECFLCASTMLEQMGMKRALHGHTYLAWAAALTAQSEKRLYAVRERIYHPIALRQQTTPQNVERLIRHAVESTMDAIGADKLYDFFGNTIDPMRGKPTNAQMIGMLAQKIRVENKS